MLDIFSVIVLCGLVSFTWSIVKTCQAKWKNEPPGPVPLPLIGDLLMFLSKPHLKLKELSKRYGDVATLHIGSRTVVVVNGIKALREALVGKSHDFDGRADSYIGNLVSGGGNDLVFAQYGEKWKLHRQLCVRGLAFAAGERMSKFENVIREEAQDLVSRLLTSQAKTIDPQLDISLGVVNTICYLTFGCHYDKSDPEFLKSVNYIDIIAEGFEDSLGHAVDFFPWLKALRIGSLEKLRAGLKIRDDVMASQLDSHRDDKLDRKDFTSFLLQEAGKTAKRREILEDKNLKMLMFDLFGAGVDTTVVAIRWAIAYLIHWPECQRKMAEEIRKVKPDNQPIGISDIKDLPYTQAVVNETLRLCSLFPVTPRKATRDTSLCGYSIKKGTDVIFNLWGVNHDEEYWEQPNEFIPERFMESNGELKSVRNLSYAPFSAGGRGCPGASIAQKEIFLILATLVQSLEIKPAEDLPSLECVSTVSYKPPPYRCLFTARL